ncbi:MAG: alpha/beta fold hydrolase [Sphingomonadales bacterium]|nr:alpha/beta fold hydrolase [Sphingomonadales bacterium]
MIRCRYATVGARQVHYRLAGNGPPLVLVHQSPRSSAEYLPLIEAWSTYFTVIAPDTPGNGLSDPLPLEDPTIPDYAEALAAFLDAIGVSRAAFYGFHTGAATAACMARLFPERVTQAVANGFAMMGEEERADFLAHYLPEILPSWDGAHLAWAWARIREQTLFFPWYKAEAGTRMIYDVYGPGDAHEQLMDMLAVGNDYRAPYRAAFAFDKKTVFEGATAPLTIMAAPPDPLYAHLDRLPEPPETITVYRGRDREDALAKALEILRAAEDGGAEIDTAFRFPDGGGLARRYVDVAGSQIHLRCGPDRGRRPLVVLHDIGFSGRALAEELAELAETHTVIAPDLPAHGASGVTGAGGSLGGTGAALAEALDAVTADGVDILAFGHSAAVAGDLGDRLGPRVGRTVLADALLPQGRDDYQERYFPDLTPQAAGGHLLAGWRFVRGRALFWPWYDERAAAVIPTDRAALEPARLQEELIAHLQAAPEHRALFTEALAAPPRDTHDRLRWVLPAWTKGHDGLTQPEAPRLYESTKPGARMAALKDVLM